MQCDLLLRGGKVIDAGMGIEHVADVAICGGRVVDVGEELSPEGAARVIEVAGYLVVPGLVDIHAHVYPSVTTMSVEPDRDCLARGTTTVVDAGSAGAYNFGGFRRFVAEPARAQVLAFLNISCIGIPIDDISMAELAWLPLVNVNAAVETIEANRDLIVGIKVRMGREVVWDNGIEPLLLALEAAERTGLPLMVHIGDSPAPVGEILNLMRPGDILTHAFTSFGGLEIAADRKSYRVRPFEARGTGKTLLDADGCVISEAWAARQRGVLFDVGHGGGSFSHEVGRACIEQGLLPDIISTDLHTGSVNGPVYDLPTLMSRFLTLGMTLAQIIEATTHRPAQAIGRGNQFGALRPGTLGDITVLELLRGSFEYLDASRQTLRGGYKFIPRLTVRAGVPVEGERAPSVGE